MTSVQQQDDKMVSDKQPLEPKLSEGLKNSEIAVHYVNWNYIFTGEVSLIGVITEASDDIVTITIEAEEHFVDREKLRWNFMIGDKVRKSKMLNLAL